MVETLGMPAGDFLDTMELAESYFVFDERSGSWDHPPLGTARVVQSRNKCSLHYYVKNDVSTFDRPRLESVEDCNRSRAELPPSWRVTLREGRPLYVFEKDGRVVKEQPTRPMRIAFQDRFKPKLRAEEGFDRYLQVLQRIFVWQPGRRISAKDAADLLP
jgi:hypothetical protein